MPRVVAVSGSGESHGWTGYFKSVGSIGFRGELVPVAPAWISLGMLEFQSREVGVAMVGLKRYGPVTPA